MNLLPLLGRFYAVSPHMTRAQLAASLSGVSNLGLCYDPAVIVPVSAAAVAAPETAGAGEGAEQQSDNQQQQQQPSSTTTTTTATTTFRGGDEARLTKIFLDDVSATVSTTRPGMSSSTSSSSSSSSLARPFSQRPTAPGNVWDCLRGWEAAFVPAARHLLMKQRQEQQQQPEGKSISSISSSSSSSRLLNPASFLELFVDATTTTHATAINNHSAASAAAAEDIFLASLTTNSQFKFPQQVVLLSALVAPMLEGSVTELLTAQHSGQQLLLAVRLSLEALISNNAMNHTNLVRDVFFLNWREDRTAILDIVRLLRFFTCPLIVAVAASSSAGAMQSMQELLRDVCGELQAWMETAPAPDLAWLLPLSATLTVSAMSASLKKNDSIINNNHKGDNEADKLLAELLNTARSFAKKQHQIELLDEATRIVVKSLAGDFSVAAFEAGDETQIRGANSDVELIRIALRLLSSPSTGTAAATALATQEGIDAARVADLIKVMPPIHTSVALYVAASLHNGNARLSSSPADGATTAISRLLSALTQHLTCEAECNAAVFCDRTAARLFVQLVEAASGEKDKENNSLAANPEEHIASLSSLAAVDAIDTYLAPQLLFKKKNQQQQQQQQQQQSLSPAFNQASSLSLLPCCAAIHLQQQQQQQSRTTSAAPSASEILTAFLSHDRRIHAHTFFSLLNSISDSIAQDRNESTGGENTIRQLVDSQQNNLTSRIYPADLQTSPRVKLAFLAVASPKQPSVVSTKAALTTTAAENVDEESAQPAASGESAPSTELQTSNAAISYCEKLRIAVKGSAATTSNDNNINNSSSNLTADEIEKLSDPQEISTVLLDQTSGPLRDRLIALALICELQADRLSSVLHPEIVERLVVEFISSSLSFSSIDEYEQMLACFLRVASGLTHAIAVDAAAALTPRAVSAATLDLFCFTSDTQRDHPLYGAAKTVTQMLCEECSTCFSHSSGGGDSNKVGSMGVVRALLAFFQTGSFGDNKCGSATTLNTLIITTAGRNESSSFSSLSSSPAAFATETTVFVPPLTLCVELFRSFAVNVIHNNNTRRGVVDSKRLNDVLRCAAFVQDLYLGTASTATSNSKTGGQFAHTMGLLVTVALQRMVSDINNSNSSNNDNNNNENGNSLSSHHHDIIETLGYLTPLLAFEPDTTMHSLLVRSQLDEIVAFSLRALEKEEEAKKRGGSVSAEAVSARLQHSQLTLLASTSVMRHVAGIDSMQNARKVDEGGDIDDDDHDNGNDGKNFVHLSARLRRLRHRVFTTIPQLATAAFKTSTDEGDDAAAAATRHSSPSVHVSFDILRCLILSADTAAQHIAALNHANDWLSAFEQDAAALFPLLGKLAAVLRNSMQASMYISCGDADVCAAAERAVLKLLDVQLELLHGSELFDALAFTVSLVCAARLQLSIHPDAIVDAFDRYAEATARYRVDCVPLAIVSLAKLSPSALSPEHLEMMLSPLVSLLNSTNLLQSETGMLRLWSNPLPAGVAPLPSTAAEELLSELVFALAQIPASGAYEIIPASVIAAAHQAAAEAAAAANSGAEQHSTDEATTVMQQQQHQPFAASPRLLLDGHVATAAEQEQYLQQEEQQQTSSSSDPSAASAAGEEGQEQQQQEDPATAAARKLNLSPSKLAVSANMRELADLAVEHSTRFVSGKAISRLLRGLSAFRLLNRDIYRVFSARLKRRPILYSMERSDVSLAASAFAQGKFLDEALFKKIAERICWQIDQHEPADVVLSLRAFHSLHLVNDAVYDSLFTRAADIQDRLSATSCVEVLSTLALEGADERVAHRTCRKLTDRVIAQLDSGLVGADDIVAVLVAFSACDYSDMEQSERLVERLVQDCQGLSSQSLQTLCALMVERNWRDDKVLAALAEHALTMHRAGMLEPAGARRILDTYSHFLFHHEGLRLELSDSARQISRDVPPPELIEASDGEKAAMVLIEASLKQQKMQEEAEKASQTAQEASQTEAAAGM